MSDNDTKTVIEVKVIIDGKLHTHHVTGGLVKERIRALLVRPEGVTREEIMALTGWPSVSVQAEFSNWNLEWIEDDSVKPTRFYLKGWRVPEEVRR